MRGVKVERKVNEKRKERVDVKIKMEEIENREERGNKKRGGSESREREDSEKRYRKYCRMKVKSVGTGREKGQEEGKGKGGLK